MCALLFFCVQVNGQEEVDVDAVVKKAECIREKATAEADQLSQEMLRVSDKMEKRMRRYEKKLANYLKKNDSLQQQVTGILNNPVDNSFLNTIVRLK